MGKFTVVPQNTFSALQLDAGVLLKNFDPENPVAPADADIICATTGGVNPSCVPTYSDMGEDVDNVPNNMMEFKHLDGWDCKLATTSLGTSPELIKLSLGVADVTGNKIVPRMDLKQSDFSDLWWVGDRADGGFVAIQVKNALSTGGFSLQTTKNGKGQIELEITGHVSLAAQKEVPMVFYSADPSEDGTVYNVTQNLTNVTSSFTGTTIVDGASFTATLTPDDDHTMDTVTVSMGGADISATAYDTDTKTVTIGTVTGSIIITATATSGV